MKNNKEAKWYLPWRGKFKDNEIDSDAYYALLSLGFQSQKIKKVINNIQNDKDDLSTKSLIKESLKKLR